MRETVRLIINDIFFFFGKLIILCAFIEIRNKNSNTIETVSENS